MTESERSSGSTPHDVVFAVDDEEGDRKLLRRIIEQSDVACDCRVFAAGEELLDALFGVLRGAQPPVACIIDVKMHGMSGLDVLRWIRAQRGLDTIPVIMLSSSDDPQYLSEAHQFGAQCYASKFPAPDQLREMIAAARRYSVAASCSSAFPLSWNMLVGSDAAMSG